MPAKPTVLLVEPIHAHYLNLLERRCRVVRPKGFSEEALAEAAREADGILIRTKGLVNDRIMAAAPKLRVIARHGVGVDHIDCEAAARRGIWVVYTPAGSLDAVAEHTWMMILALAKHARTGDAAVRTGDYESRARNESLQLRGKVLGVLGLGRIGGRVAEIAARGFGMRVLYTDLLRYPKKERASGAKKVPFARLLKQSDVLTVHLPLTERTRGILGAKELARMKPGARLINCARGAIVDTYAVAEALAKGPLGGAGLDVFDPEVPAPDHPILKDPRAILSPHNAAQTAEARFNYAAVVEDVLRVLAGKRPLYPANEPQQMRL
ncbi:MAG: hydroxyacid dehydrogenase [Planctomycetota bacterium]|nr:hydroxyacid dehydrogenase [Planctomycetota bacterium]